MCFPSVFMYIEWGVCWSNVATSFGDQSADPPQPTHQPSVPIVQPFTHTEALKGLSCGSLWGLSLSCRVYSIDASSHRFRPSDHMCVNERSVVATISGGNSQWWQQSVVAAVSAETTCWRPLLYLGIAIVVLHGCSLTVMICCAVFAGLASC